MKPIEVTDRKGGELNSPPLVKGGVGEFSPSSRAIPIGYTQPGFFTAASRGFTLIELLIVVAIIGLLAAIATVSFLEAQVRAKVSRAKADLRTLVVAVESYAVDQGRYPIAADVKGEAIVPYPPIGLGPEAFETRMASALTTPESYLASLPRDPFAAQGPDPEDPLIVEGEGYHYGSQDYALANDGPGGVVKLANFIWMYGGSPQVTLYYLSSHGPDLDHDDDEELSDVHAAVPYDPTNGTVSSGDLVLPGPSGSFAE